jgi:Nucleotidyl transferase AbiEii toxin, Type IV TA system
VVDETPRSRQARLAAETALVRVVHHYGGRPEFVLLGGLVPDLLCSGSAFQHAGTTDVDVQVNLEIAYGSVSASRLETALRNADFVPSTDKVWRWQAEGVPTKTIVKFELLADLDDSPAEAIVEFVGCDELGAVNLRGTGFAAMDYTAQTMTARVGGVVHDVQVNVAGIAGFLLAKTAAAHSRRKPKDWYDIAFVLLHNDEGGPDAAATRVVDRFGDALHGSIRTALDDLLANFATTAAQGARAYAQQITQDHAELSAAEAAADAVAAVHEFLAVLYA